MGLGDCGKGREQLGSSEDHGNEVYEGGCEEVKMVVGREKAKGKREAAAAALLLRSDILAQFVSHWR